MAWPPPILPTNRTDELVQLGNHPADHNNTNQVVNDLALRAQNQYAFLQDGGSGQTVATSGLSQWISMGVLPVPVWATKMYAVVSITGIMYTADQPFGATMSLRVGGEIAGRQVALFRQTGESRKDISWSVMADVSAPSTFIDIAAFRSSGTSGSFLLDATSDIFVFVIFS